MQAREGAALRIRGAMGGGGSGSDWKGEGRRTSLPENFSRQTKGKAPT